jgi:hypothetical protein
VTGHVALALDGQWRPYEQEHELPLDAMRWRPSAPIAHGLALRDDQLRWHLRKAAMHSPLHLPVVKA